MSYCARQRPPSWCSCARKTHSAAFWLTYGLSIPDVLRCATNQAPDEHSVGGDAWPLQRTTLPL